MSLRILLITDNHTPSGGAEHYFFDLKTRLKQIPDLEIYSLGFAATEKSADDFYTFKKTKSKFTKLIWQLIPHPFVYYKLRRQIKKINPDVIHLHNIREYTASLLAAVKGYPLVQTIHDYAAVCPIAYNIHKNLEACPTGMRASCFWQHQLKYNLFTYLALTLAFLRNRSRSKRMIKTFFAPSPLLVDYLKKNQFENAIYIAPFKNEPQAPAFEAIDAHHFLFAGNLGAHKGIDLLLDEFAIACQKNSALTLTIIGKGQDEHRLRKRVDKLGLANQIDFAGWLDNPEPEYARSAAVIFPSLWMEAFGLVITEAMNHSRPVIGSNRGSPPWIIDDTKTGFIFDPLKKGDLAEKILLLAGNIELIMLLGKNGEQKLQTFIDNEKVLQQIVEVYRGISG